MKSRQDGFEPQINMVFDSRIMGKKLLIAIVCVLPVVLNGQDLCSDCALTIRHFPNDTECCESCLYEYYTTKLKQNIIKGTLSDYYSKENFFNFIPIPDTVEADFRVWKINRLVGYYLDDFDDLCRGNFYLISLTIDTSSVFDNSSIVLITNHIADFEIGNTYHLKLLPYFCVNLNSRIENGQQETIAGPSHTLLDLVYKRWMIPALPLGTNYFFMN